MVLHFFSMVTQVSVIFAVVVSFLHSNVFLEWKCNSVSVRQYNYTCG